MVRGQDRDAGLGQQQFGVQAVLVEWGSQDSDISVATADSRSGAAGLDGTTMAASTAPSAAGYGSFHRWLALPVQSQICSWVPEPPYPVSSRHLPDCGL
jgi:hypothetical protein